MSEQILGQQEGQPVTPDAQPFDNEQGAPNQETPQYVTSQQLQEFAEKILSQAEEKILPKAQSMFDKKSNAIDAKISQLQAAGIKATPEQAAALVEQDEKLSGQKAPAAQQKPAPETPVDTEKANWIKAVGGNPSDPNYGTMYAVSKAYGFRIEQDDPEMEHLTQKFDDTDALVATYTKALAEKQLRLSQNNDKTSFAAAPAAFSGGQRSTGIPMGADPITVLTEGLKSRRR